ncbi:Abi family protein [Paenibacillus glufosinatiresistens]|uniref:Abi family protein n=1 Tax=Paenibacillus glufosinatiresistens TaxID=3070657 RepID=UPI00286E3701|nr:Abi family protein [Paenibacillus sp. YX.27]
MPPEKVSVKPPATFKEQLQILRTRGIVISNDQLALQMLEKINYYRLTAYALEFKKDDHYIEGTTFSRICSLYEFDRQLRYLLMGLIEQVEIAFRTHISYSISHTYGSLGHLEACHFKDEFFHSKFLEKLDKEYRRSNEIFIKHHLCKYNGVIPVWVAVEVLSFGDLSKLFANMKNVDKNRISKEYYQIPFDYIESWLKCLSVIRNICAHYGRLYNRPLTSRPKLDSQTRRLGLDSARIFAPILVLKQLTLDYDQWTNFITHLEALIHRFNEDIHLAHIGFPDNWESLLRN